MKWISCERERESERQGEGEEEEEEQEEKRKRKKKRCRERVRGRPKCCAVLPSYCGRQEHLPHCHQGPVTWRNSIV